MVLMTHELHRFSSGEPVFFSLFIMVHLIMYVLIFLGLRVRGVTLCLLLFPSTSAVGRSSSGASFIDHGMTATAW
jgi:hypothetical protein